MTQNNFLSYIELSKKNLIHNIKSFRSLVKSETEFSLAVKGNAYGHGLKEIVSMASPHIDYFQVNSFEELKALREVTNKKTLVLGYIKKDNLKEAIKLKCILSIFSVIQLKEINKIAKNNKMVQEIHLPFDAYLGREGFLLSELPEVLKYFTENKNIKLGGIYAHFANIEDTVNFSHAQKQIDEYQKALDLVKEYKFQNVKTHISATSGLLAYEVDLPGNKRNNIIRLGIGVYGMWPSIYLKIKYKKLRPSFTLEPVLSWKTKIAQIKTLPKGHTIGYGLTFKTTKETKVAIIPQGYADGLSRAFSNNGEVLVRGTKCKILGRVMMNMFVIDISHLSKVSVEDEVVILGSQNKQNISAEELANRINTINYEITTRISSLLPRVVE